MEIKNGEANINRMPVANMGGMVSTATLMASQVVPQVKQTRVNSRNIVTLRI